MKLKLKEDKVGQFFNGLKLINISNEVGLSTGHLSQIKNNKCDCSKSTAIAITCVINKMKNKEYEMYDFFENVEKLDN